MQRNFDSISRDLLESSGFVIYVHVCLSNSRKLLKQPKMYAHKLLTCREQIADSVTIIFPPTIHLTQTVQYRAAVCFSQTIAACKALGITGTGH